MTKKLTKILDEVREIFHVYHGRFIVVIKEKESEDGINLGVWEQGRSRALDIFSYRCRDLSRGGIVGILI